MRNRKAGSPMEAVQMAIEVMAEAGYEDTDVTEEELAVAHRRFENAVKYIISNVSRETIQDLQVENMRLRERVTDLEVKYEHLRSVLARLDDEKV